MFDMKLLFLVWKSHSIRGNDSPEALRKRLTLFYIQFCKYFIQIDVGLFIYITLNYFYPNDVWMVIVRSIFLFPQIIFNARVGNNPGFNPFYILGYVGIRLLIPLYNYSCPDNRFLLSPNFTLIMVIISIFIFEVITIVYRFCFFCCNINQAQDFLFPSIFCQIISNTAKRFIKPKRIKTLTAQFAFKIFFPAI